MLVVVSISGCSFTERGGNRSTKFYLGTYLTSLSMTWPKELDPDFCRIVYMYVILQIFSNKCDGDFVGGSVGDCLDGSLSGNVFLGRGYPGKFSVEQSRIDAVSKLNLLMPGQLGGGSGASSSAQGAPPSPPYKYGGVELRRMP